MSLSRFHQDSWNEKDGAPASIYRIRQTPDGLLWLAANDGLWRFDGISFERITGFDVKGSNPSAATALLVTRKGELWIGFGQGGGVARYVNGRVIDMKLPDPPASITYLAEGPDGAVYAEWGGISQRLWRWNGTRWDQVDDALGLPAGYLMEMVGTPDGALWVPVLSADWSQTRIARLMPEERRFRMLPGTNGLGQLEKDQQGQLWLSGRLGIRRYIPEGGTAPLHALPGDGGLRYFGFDPWGGIWGGTKGSGTITRINTAGPPGGGAETVQSSEASASGRLFDIYTDAQGAVWVSDSRGLNRFRPADVQMQPEIPGDGRAGIRLAVTGDGTVYAAARGQLYRFRSGSDAEPLLPLADNGTFCGGGGSALFVFHSNKLYSFDGGGALRYLTSAPADPSDCAIDAGGRLWLRGLDGSTWRYEQGRFRNFPRLEARARGGLLGIAANRAGEIGVPLDQDRVAVISGDGTLLYDLRAAGGREMNALSPGLGGFVALTATGPVRLANGRATRLDATSAPWVRRLGSMVETSRGESWFTTADGLSMVRTADLLAAFAKPGTPLPRRKFDASDGVAGQAQRIGLTGTQSVVGGDGRIWAIRSAGLASVDPGALSDNRTPPNIVFRALVTEQERIRDPLSTSLPPGTRSVRFEFSATGIGNPERVRLRYRLEGADHRWTDAGKRREASYANLGPGQYSFVIMAANEEGEWRTGTLSFQIRPTFLESWYFKAICALLLIALLWLAYRIRVISISRRLRVRLAERHDERERIARELHDTLLQSVQALLLDFHLTAASLREGKVGADRLDSAIEHAEAVIAEGRDRVQNLRSRSDIDTLEPLLRAVAERQGLVEGQGLRITSSGPSRPLDPWAGEEIGRMATEALFNIVRHASATQVSITINYLPKTLTIAFIDNGVGIDPAVLKAGRRPGHFGLIGMQERARKLKGRMLFDRRPGGGTEVTLVLPGAMAFLDDGFSLPNPLRCLRRFLSRR